MFFDPRKSRLIPPFPFEYTHDEYNILDRTLGCVKSDDGVDLRQALMNCRHEPDANKFFPSGIEKCDVLLPTTSILNCACD
jgi:hypothetical protein